MSLANPRQIFMEVKILMNTVRLGIDTRIKYKNAEKTMMSVKQ